MKEKVIHSIVKIVSIGVFTAFVMSLAVTANAQCGGTFESLMSAIASSRGFSKVTKLPAESILSTQKELVSDKAANPSIVGLWHIKFMIDTPNGPAVFQEAFQAWNTGGTEIHNPKVDPRGGSVCLGTWAQGPGLTFNLAHRVWIYDTAGNFQVLVNLTENLTLNDRGTTQTGGFTLQPVDADGNPLGDPLIGHVVGERITPN